jgi:Undecaprenyl-phosphate galactose phosphotransferase WbaP
MLTLGMFLGFRAWSFINPAIPLLRGGIWMAGSLAVFVFAFQGLYPGIGLAPVEHLRRICRGVTLLYIVLTAVMFMVKDWRVNSRGALFIAWILSLALAPFGRWICSVILGPSQYWGIPVMLFGAGSTTRSLIQNLRNCRTLGYKPVVCLDDDPGKHGSCEGIPVVGYLDEAPFVAPMYQAQWAIVAMPGMSRDRLVRHLGVWSKIFNNVLVVPDLFGVASLWIEPRDLGGILSLEIRHNLLNPVNRVIKRAMDIIIASFSLTLSLPLLAVAAAWIKRVSPGPAFYIQEREGKDGQPIKVLKLRTMYPGADAMLQRYLGENQAARQEWNRFCKLKNDPRVIRGIGRFLRKTSLDELPQLWNILKGEMSLVGPRPFPAYHNQQFSGEFRNLRTQVTPGLTGFWQVSARSNGDLTVQESLDSYYIQNWSLWLDLYILIRTVSVVLCADGAY